MVRIGLLKEIRVVSELGKFRPPAGKLSSQFEFSAANSRKPNLFARSVKCGGNGRQKLKGRRKKGGGSVEGTQKLDERSRKFSLCHFLPQVSELLACASATNGH